MRLLGLYREPECSPGQHRSNDVLLLEQVAASLRSHGVAVDLTTIERSGGMWRSAALVLSMCQGRSPLDVISGWEKQGVRIINSPQASLNTYRERLSAVMQQAGLRFPPTRVVPTRGPVQLDVDVNGGVWLKRGDVHAAVNADVQWVDSAERLRAALDEFRSRGITHAALQRHVPGDEIKFYGLAGGRFFHWLDAPAPNRNGPVLHGASVRRAKVDIEALHELAEGAASAAGLEIYGGDAIVGPEGELTLIDLNDWPSFAPCRDRASNAIAEYIQTRMSVGRRRRSHALPEAHPAASGAAPANARSGDPARWGSTARGK